MLLKLSQLAASAGMIALTLTFGSGTANASFLVPQTHHPGVFFEKYATPLPYFDGTSGPSRVDGSSPVDVNYEELRQRILAETFYDGGGPFGLLPQLPPYDAGTLIWGFDVGGTGALWPGVTIEAVRGTPTEVTYTNNIANAPGKPGPELQTLLTVDQTIHWANPLQEPGPPISRLEMPPYAGPQPTVPHLHGAEVPSAYDGSPDQWFTHDGRHGPGYRTVAGAAANQAIYRHTNSQQGTTLWFHDHTLGITRINVFAGLEAYYFLRDGFDNGDESDTLGLPSGEYELEFLIQDRMFDILGNFLFPDGLPFFTPNPQHPFWNPEFLGDVNTVNGRSWPYLDVEQRRYRLRFLNGSNARFYNVSLQGGGKGKGKNKSTPQFWVIGTDGGLLDTAVATKDLLIAPGERYDVIVDFTNVPLGTTLTMVNDAKAPYPFGETADPQTVGQVAEIRVTAPAASNSPFTPDPATGGNPALRDATAATPDPIVRLPGAPGGPAVDLTAGTGNVQKVRQLTLNEIPGAFGPLDAVLNNTRWAGLRDDGTATSADGLSLDWGDAGNAVTDWLTELPQVGSTEIWEIVNLTGDAHPIHLHLVQFQVMNRQGYSLKQYEKEYIRNFPGGAAANPNQAFFIPHFGPPLGYNDTADPASLVYTGKYGGNPNIDPFLRGSPEAPTAYEQGWKDTVIVPPKKVTRIVVRFAPQHLALGAVTPGTNYYPFDPTLVGTTPGDEGNGVVADPDNPDGPGYVWHCHILDHEDNEMMRPYAPVNNADNMLDMP